MRGCGDDRCVPEIRSPNVVIRRSNRAVVVTIRSRAERHRLAERITPDGIVRRVDFSVAVVVPNEQVAGPFNTEVIEEELAGSGRLEPLLNSVISTVSISPASTLFAEYRSGRRAVDCHSICGIPLCMFPRELT